MKKKSLFASLRRVLLPIVHGCADDSALDLALRLAPEVVLVGIVPLMDGEAMSAGAAKAQELRNHMRPLGKGEQVRVRAQVLVTADSWKELQAVVQAEQPDLLVLDLSHMLPAMKLSPSTALSGPPCDVALLRGSIVPHPRVFVPVRGGPFSELAVRLGLALHAPQLQCVTMQLRGDENPSAPLMALQRVLQSMPEVTQRAIVTDDVAKTIVAESLAVDLVVLGATAKAHNSKNGITLGPVAQRVLDESKTPVIIVGTQRPVPISFTDATAGAQAISILVDKWFAENTFHANEFDDIEQLIALKHEQGVTISLALPALNEEESVGRVISTVKDALMDRAPLLDEIVLIDSNSEDRTREIARELGVPVYIHQELLPELGPRRGKGEALWKSLLVTKGDIIAWIDTDIANIHPRFVYGIVGPMLMSPHVQFVKGFYRRPLKTDEGMQTSGGGRVTELAARPLLNLFYPELSGVIQPLSGEYAGRRAALEQCSFFSGYGVETGLLIDIFDKFGLNAIAQVDLLERVHHNQDLEALSKMSFAIIQTVMRKLEQRYERAFIADVNKSMKLIRSTAGGYYLHVEEIVERDRPPMIEVEAYQKWRERESVLG